MLKFELLEDQNYCQHCDICGSYCQQSIQRYNAALCKECRLCFSICPQFRPPSFRQQDSDLDLGHFQKVWAVKSFERPLGSQDSGFVTILVKNLLRESIIDAALLTSRNKLWVPKPFLASTPEQAEKASGSKFTICPSLSLLGQALDRFGRLAIVGLPCQISALRNYLNTRRGQEHRQSIILTIGLFCMNSFQYRNPLGTGMMDLLEKELPISIGEIDKIEIKKGKLRIYSSSYKAIAIRDIKDFQTAVWPICLGCVDFTSLGADISVGSVGALEEHTNTVIARTEQARFLVEKLRANGMIEVREMDDLSEIKKIARFKRKRGEALSQEAKAFLRKQLPRGKWLRRFHIRK